MLNSRVCSNRFVIPETKLICQLYFGIAPIDPVTNSWKFSCGNVRKQNIKLGWSMKKIMTRMKMNTNLRKNGDILN